MSQKSSAQAPRSDNLTRRMEQALRQRISEGPLQPGERLPTEKRLAEEFGVSRTVVREAIAALRAAGLVEPRQGAGVFVKAGATPAGWPAAFAGDLDNPWAALDLLELRTTVEIQAAGLAAARRSWAQEARIRECYEAMQRLVDAGAPTEEADLAFHLAIAEATNNAAFVAFLDMLGRNAIPRRLVRDLKGGALITPQYLRKVQDEHLMLADAISRGDAAAARAAMEQHLAGSQARYRRLLAED
jgi:DNA-binding FadR family transcriptional regulator